jgi:CBS domain-containing protein/mannitol/fructose-specific phosphotransferase system IIA component (Ntr-type)
MKLSDVIAAERVIVPLEGDTVTAATTALLARAAAAGTVSNVAKLRSRVEEERPEDIVAMGDRAFLLHYRTDAVDSLVVALGTAAQPICRELGDEETQCARIVLLIAAPPRLATRYLQVVGAFARLLSKQPVVEQILATSTAEQLAGLPIFQEKEIPEQLTVRELMTERPRTISPETPLRHAARDMVRYGIGGIPVVDADGRVIGMLGERELIRTLLGDYVNAGRGAQAAPHSREQATVRDAMTKQVMCVSPEQPIAEVSSIMTNKDVDRVPVVRDGRIVGLLTRGDIVRKLIGY